MTDTNQDSEDELQRYHLSGCAKYETLRGIYPNDRRLTGNPCSCGIETILRAEKLKLLAEVRERVVGESDYQPGNPAPDLVEHNRLVRDGLRFEQRAALTKLEAEL